MAKPDNDAVNALGKLLRFDGSDKENIPENPIQIKEKEKTPSPANFAEFVPWAYLQMLEFNDELKEVVVEKRSYAERHKITLRTVQSGVSLASTASPNKPHLVGTASLSESNSIPAPDLFRSRVLDINRKISPIDVNERVPPTTQVSNAFGVNSLFGVKILAFYDHRDKLLEISIVRCNTLNRKVMKIICLAIPFQDALSSIMITKCKLDQMIIYELGSVLPQSNITEVCLDDTKNKQGNYYILLNTFSQLKRLSLNRCGIGDRVAYEIFKRLDYDKPASKSLAVLEISSNNLTDTSAFEIGNILRRNRSIVHLNLSDNQITDEGAISIINSLKEFTLTDAEKRQKHLSRMTYAKKRAEIYAKCYDQTFESQKMYHTSASVSATSRVQRPIKKHLPHMMSKRSDLSVLAKKMTEAILGKYDHPYSREHIVIKEDQIISCRGNFKLCSLNLAYNDLNVFFAKQLCVVLQYQSETPKQHGKNTGLLRVVIDGNNIHNKGNDFECIKSLLHRAVNQISKHHIQPTIQKPKIFKRQGKQI